MSKDLLSPSFAHTLSSKRIVEQLSDFPSYVDRIHWIRY